jgi:D-lactate dehydrogenase
MRVAVFSTKPYDKVYLTQFNQNPDIDLQFFDNGLNNQTTALAEGYTAVCVFVNDVLDDTVLSDLSKHGVKHVALRCAGFNNVNLAKAKELNISVSRVPAYSPQAVAEHAVALILTLNRKLHKAYNRVRENNFSLHGLLGFNLYGKTVGVIGTGNIGEAFVNIMLGFGCQVKCYDPIPKQHLIERGAEYVSLDVLFKQGQIISLHCPLNASTTHLINSQSIEQMQDGVMLINTSRGGLIDSKAIIQALKKGRIGYLGLDVYEMEADLFFEDHSAAIIQDDVFERLASFPNVLITGHQGFFTHEAMQQIAQITLGNLQAVQQNRQIEARFL